MWLYGAGYIACNISMGRGAAIFRFKQSKKNSVAVERMAVFPNVGNYLPNEHLNSAEGYPSPNI
jgi:hypothetical protein